MEMRTFRRLLGELKWICDTSLYVSVAKLWNYLMLFASSASVLLIVYSRMQQNNARRLWTTQNTGDNHRPFCLEVGLSYAKGVSGHQTLFVTHVSTNTFVDVLLTRVSTWFRVCGGVSSQKEAGGVFQPRSFLDFSFYIYHLGDVFHLWIQPHSLVFQ